MFFAAKPPVKPLPYCAGTPTDMADTMSPVSPAWLTEAVCTRTT